MKKKIGATVAVVSGRIVGANMDKASLIKEFEAAAKEGYPKIKELLAQRSKLREEFTKEYNAICEKIRDVSEHYGLPYGDSEGYMSDDFHMGEWAYIPESMEKYSGHNIGNDIHEIVLRYDDLEGIGDYHFSSNLNLPFGEWVGSSC